MLALLHCIAPLCAAFVAYAVMGGEDEDDRETRARRQRVIRIGAAIAAIAVTTAAIIDATTWVALPSFTQVFNAVMLAVDVGALAIIVKAARAQTRDDRATESGFP
jgi:hypothetical protein